MAQQAVLATASVAWTLTVLGFLLARMGDRRLAERVLWPALLVHCTTIGLTVGYYLWR